MKKHFVKNSVNNLKASSKALKTYKQCQMLTHTDFAYFGLLTPPLSGFKRAQFSPLVEVHPIKHHRFNNHLPYVLVNSWYVPSAYGNNACVPKEDPFLVPRIWGGQINLSLKLKLSVLKNFTKASLSRNASELALELLDRTSPRKTDLSPRLRLAQNYNILGCVVIRPKCVLFISPKELKQSALVQSAGCAHPELSSLKLLKRVLRKQCLKPRLLLTACVQRCIKLSLSQPTKQSQPCTCDLGFDHCACD